MKTFISSSIILCCVFSNQLFSQFKLEVEITGFRNIKGVVLMELYSNSHKLIKQQKLSLRDKSCTTTFESLNASKYAIRYFHDENENYELDKNFLGVPTEGYGFSNNVLAKFGPPDFEKWIFEVKGDTKLKLKIKYH